MILDFNTICAMTSGAARIAEKDDGIHFYRFTEAQEAFYEQFPGHYPVTFSTAGVRFCFRTNSPTLDLKMQFNHVGARYYFALDVYVNGAFIGDIRNFEELELMRKYTLQEQPMGEHHKCFELGEGEKEVIVYFPWNVEAVLKEISLEDGATITPTPAQKKLLCFGDSITMGHDALHTPRRYTAQLADYLGYAEYNKGIGGERFPPDLALLPEDFTPDLITVGYGTNDWRRRTLDEFQTACREFYLNLRKTYPDTPIYAIAPIWRNICKNTYDCGPFRDIPKFFNEVASEIPNMTVIDAFPFVPPYTDYYADLTLHPNGAGFDRYFEGLKPYFEKYKA